MEGDNNENELVDYASDDEDYQTDKKNGNANVDQN
jgi:hypothetical protein